MTSAGADEAANFGVDGIPAHSGRYERAEEFVDVTLALWDSWEDGAVVLNPETGVFADPDKVHTIDHDGPRFRIKGPLNSPRSAQGRPLLVQAGSSESGKEFAARYAEAVFTAQRTLEQGQEFYRDLKARVVKHGRTAGDLKVLPGIVPFIADTEEEAKALEQSFTDLISPEYSLRQLSTMLGVDLTKHSLDAPLPPLPPLDEIQGNKSRYQLVKDLAADGSLTVRQLIGLLGGGRGHRTFAGTPEQVADELQTWFEQRGRRFQHHAAVPARRTRRLRRPGRPDPAAAGTVPHGVHGDHPAWSLRSRGRRQPVRGCGRRSERMSGETGLKPLVTTVFVPAAIFGIGQGPPPRSWR